MSPKISFALSFQSLGPEFRSLPAIVHTTMSKPDTTCLRDLQNKRAAFKITVISVLEPIVPTVGYPILVQKMTELKHIHFPPLFSSVMECNS